MPETPLFYAGLSSVKCVFVALPSKKDCKGRGFELIFKIFVGLFFQVFYQKARHRQVLFGFTNPYIFSIFARFKIK